jgi:chromate reductase, NAD(P)H dehydrogenase (quinone)
LTNHFRRCAVRILAVSGSLRDDSYNRRLLAVAAAGAGAGVHVDIWDGLACLPIFDEDLEAQGITLAVARLKEAIRTADAVLIASPEYNGSIPGGLKNALDWVSRPHATNVLSGKPVALIGASPSRRGARSAQDDLRRVLTIIGADVVPSDLAVSSVHHRFHNGIPDAELQSQLADVMVGLTSHVSGAGAALAS